MEVFFVQVLDSFWAKRTNTTVVFGGFIKERMFEGIQDCSGVMSTVLLYYMIYKQKSRI